MYVGEDKSVVFYCVKRRKQTIWKTLDFYWWKYGKDLKEV
jgi:hypothetical protein